MKVERLFHNSIYTTIAVQPWPEDRLAAHVTVFYIAESGKVKINYGHDADISTAREWAQAILRACDIAEQLERDGAIIIEGETTVAGD